MVILFSVGCRPLLTDENKYIRIDKHLKSESGMDAVSKISSVIFLYE